MSFKHFFVFFVIALFLLSPLKLRAEQSSVLRPLADGGDDSTLWTNISGTACNAADCYTEVDESSGSTCTNSDGDSSYISSQDIDVSQTFDIDESNIPDGATVSAIAVSVCYIKQGGGAGNPTFQTRICENGACSNSGAALSATTSYQESSQTYSVNFNKTAATDIEIGVFAEKKNVRVSQILAVVTYTAPSVTPTPSGEVPIAQVVPRGGGGNSPTRIIFSGKAFPGALLGVYLIGQEYGNVLIDGEFEANEGGRFEKEIISPVEEKRTYGLLIKDKEGNLGKSKFFTYDLKFNTIIRQGGLIFAPTIKISKPFLSRGELLAVSGYGVPGNKIELLIGGEILENVKTESSGLYNFLIDTGKLSLGGHKIQTKQFDEESGTYSDVSELKNIRILAITFVSIDFNEDAKVDIQDWSVFLSNWFSKDEDARKRNDINGDGKLDINDFSIFLMIFQIAKSR